MNKEEIIDLYKRGIPPIQLDRPALLGDGIESFSEEEARTKEARFEAEKEQLNLVKFTPASGAATRMFKGLFEGLQDLYSQNGQLDQYSLPAESPAREFLNNLHQFPFFDEMKPFFEAHNISLPIPRDGRVEIAALDWVLDKEGLNFASLPKALIPFHKHDNGVLTALEEHFKEGISYTARGNYVRLHFTVSPEHRNAIRELAEQLVEKWKDSYRIEVEYSVQDRSTDLLAVYQDNTPVVLQDGSEFFRPAGHGALLQNLEQLQADLVFIKNIDNVAANDEKCGVSRYKRILAGHLLELKTEIHSLVNNLLAGKGLNEAKDYILREFDLQVNSMEEALEALNRPIRVCGMVLNTGAPGGGPFWVKDSSGTSSLQIVEKSQIDLRDPEQKSILENSTHFNPVDLVCWMRNAEGQAFDLFQYRNADTGFISEKTHEGKPIKVMELPGLWNGSMDGWITRFVEVPLSTFNPVKTVLNLLDENHR